MADVCAVIRKYGNEGAHGDELILSSIELDRIIRYVSTVIEYTYSLPLRVSMDFKKVGISSDESNNSNRDDATTSSTICNTRFLSPEHPSRIESNYGFYSV